MVERPQLPVTPRAVVLNGHLLLGKGEISTDEPTARVFDPVLRLGMQSIKDKPHSHPGLRRRFRPRICKFLGTTGPDDAAIAACRQHPAQLRAVDKPCAQYSVEICDGIRQAPIQ